MPKKIYQREAIEIGRCIYCGMTDGELTDEHVSPYGLNGRLELIKASCVERDRSLPEKCGNITSRIEDTVLGSMAVARAELGYRSRGRKKDPPRRMLVEKNGKVFSLKDIPYKDQWKIIRLPLFRQPAAIDGRPYESGIEVVTEGPMDQIELCERAEDIAQKHGVDRIVFPEYPPEIFARFIAKMAYGYAVGRYGLPGFEEVYVRSAILGRTNDIGRWVGCTGIKEFPVRETTISAGFGILPGMDIIVKLKLFPRFNGPEYVVVVGRVKEFHATILGDIVPPNVFRVPLTLPVSF